METEKMETASLAISRPKALYYSLIRDVPDPLRKTPKAAGMDICCPNYTKEFADELYKTNMGEVTPHFDAEHSKWSFTLSANRSMKLPLGIKVSIPEGWFLLLTPKSGVGIRTETVLLADTIDEDYQGEICLALHNTRDQSKQFFFGQSIVQGVLLPVAYVDLVKVPIEELYDEKSIRGEGGFGSTGIFH